MDSPTPTTIDRFDICLPFTLAQESPYPGDWTNVHNFSNDAHDSGGKTFMGLTQKEYDVYRKNNHMPTQDVRKITKAEGEEIYRNSYWLPHCPALAIGLDLCFFDASVNMGTTEAIKVLQAAIGVANDGDWGPKTQKALEVTTDTIIVAFSHRRSIVYQEMTGFKYFGKDWLRRTKEINAEALKMINP